MSITYFLMQGRYLTKEDIDAMYVEASKINFFEKPSIFERIKRYVGLRSSIN